MSIWNYLAGDTGFDTKSTRQPLFFIAGMWGGGAIALAIYMLWLGDILDGAIQADHAAVGAMLCLIGGTYLSFETWRAWTGRHPACKAKQSD